MVNVLSIVNAWIDRVLRKTKTQNRSPSVETSSPTKPVVTPAPFIATGSCRQCGFNRANGNSWNPDVASDETGLCVIRGFEIAQPAKTYCKNFESRDATPFGAIYSICTSRNNQCLPWVGLVAPFPADVDCDTCGQHAAGIQIDLAEGTAKACTVEHYFSWWADFLQRRLTFFKLLGERAYSDMYDVISYSGATGYYSNAKDAFHDAIATARDLEWLEEVRALEVRLDHIQSVFRSQFR